MWTDYLELLARDAAAVDYEAPVLAARSAGVPADGLEELERGKRLALQIRESLAAQRRREDELAALYDTAYDLARLSDLDSVLAAIVRRARLLLRTDTAYLSMNDPHVGDTYMRVTDGCTSAHFQQLRLGMGEGLGGRVAQNATPYSTASYFEDERFEHTDDIDGAVAEEGLVAILGVPLLLDAKVIGVLYAANRNERPFSRSEVALLSSLAAHAAAAIDKARLLDESRMALAELRSVNELLRARTRAVERASAAHDRMARAVLRGGGVDEIAEALVEAVGGVLTVRDADGRVLVRVGGPDDGPSPALLEAALTGALASGRVTSTRGPGADWSVAAVTVDRVRFGSLVLRREAPLDDADQRIMERAALVTALLLLSLRSGAEAENRVRGELLDDLLRDAGQNPDALLERGRLLGSDLSAPHEVFVVDLDGADRRRGTGAVDHLVSRRGGLAGVYEGRLVLVLPASATDGRCATAEVARQLAEELGATLTRPVTVGGAGPAAGPAAVVAAHAEAVRCVTALRTLGRAGDGSSLTELGFVGLVLGDRPDVPGFVRATLGPLLDYDERRGTDLLGTLAAYFATGGNLVRTKDALHVHVNTVAQRLERIGRLIGPDWQDPGRLLELQVALRLHQVSLPVE